MKILMLIVGLYPERTGGIEKVGADLAARLAARHEVVVYSFKRDNQYTREKRDGYLLKPLKSASDYGVKMPLGVHALNVFRELLREKPKPDIVLAMSLMNGKVAHLIRRLFNIPYLVYALGSDWYIARDTKITGWSFRSGILHSAKLITQTQLIKNDVLNLLPSADIEVIPNGLTLPVRRAAGDKIVFLGRLHKIKGLNYLIEAVRGIEGCPEVVIAGGGPEEDRLREQARGLNITFTGRVPEVESTYVQGMMYVLPSLSEGLPQAMLEAMSYGLPVVATRVGGIPEVLEHGKTGFLVEPENPEALREHIQRLLGDEPLRKTMSDNCLQEIQKYSWDHVLNKFEHLISNTVQHRP